MTKTAFKKTIACVMVIALCFVAVFTGTVSAVVAGTVTYTVTGTGYEPGAKTSYVTATVHFENADSHPFIAGMFDVVLPSGLKLLDASIAGFTAVDEPADPQISFNISNERVLFASFSNTDENDIKALTSIDILLTIVLPKQLSTYSAGTQWGTAQGFSIANVDITNANEDTYTITNGGTAPIHIHNYGDATGEGNVKTKTCSVCGATTKVVENAGSISTDNNLPVNAFNVNFTNEGDVVLNALILKSAADDGTYNGIDIDNGDKVYFSYVYRVDGGDTYKRGVATPYEVEIDDVWYYAFPCVAENGIARVSYKISGNFIAVKDGNTSISSAKFEHSILDWVNAIIANGGKSEDERNYAKALYNYAKATAQRNYETGGINHTGDYTADYYELDSDHTYTLPASPAAEIVDSDTTWNIDTVTVTTGFKPTMNIKFRGPKANPDNFTAESVIIKVKNNGNLVYSKEVATSNLEDVRTYKLFDIPTKYLVNDIEITVKNSAKTIKYSYGRYAAGLARDSATDEQKADAPVFKYLMDYAVCLNIAFPA